ncbi:type II toxin-antitoxin system RelE/ParE family toxin [Allomuricauda sp. d1]|uniref:type II toxin-antitoxin system RelE/ParE family toxin n=1 Tax=Allomuricauda sp. d1 TaxID=3136725 RepID=UPI0031D0925B
MANYKLSSQAQFDLVGIYKYGIKYFGQQQAVSYLYELEDFMLELATRPELAKDASKLGETLKYYNFKAHVIFYFHEDGDEIFIIRILGKRMDFVQHL